MSYLWKWHGEGQPQCACCGRYLRRGNCFSTCGICYDWTQRRFSNPEHRPAPPVAASSDEASATRAPADATPTSTVVEAFAEGVRDGDVTGETLAEIEAELGPTSIPATFEDTVFQAVFRTPLDSPLFQGGYPPMPFGGPVSGTASA